MPCIGESERDYPAEVTVTKAGNGYVVKKYDRMGEVIEVAKTWNEAQGIAKKLMKKRPHA